jgi:predicted nucleic acid-binding protein
MIFTDTGGWYGMSVPEDPNHLAALGWSRLNRQPLVTTDYVVDETLTLLRARGHSAAALALGRQFFDGSLATICYLTEADIRAAWQVFMRYTDKEWSFTDCTSKVIMEKLDITEAFAFDHHFRQFGTIKVVP